MIEMRELMQRLNKQYGITILISSHLLSEIEKLVTHLGVINKGRLVFQGTIRELNDRQTKSSRVTFDTSDNERTSRILKQNGYHPVINQLKVVVENISREAVGILTRQIMTNDIDLYEVRLVKSDLETIFMDLINT
jgi:ABC-2 type transport system ATP-binding protein